MSPASLRLNSTDIKPYDSRKIFQFMCHFLGKFGVGIGSKGSGIFAPIALVGLDHASAP